MKFLDKIKDLFMDEVDVDDELEIEEENEEEKKEVVNKKEENVLPKVMRDTIEKESKLDLRTNPNKEEPKKKEPEKSKDFNFPIDFELDIPSRNNRNSNNSQNIVNNTKNTVNNNQNIVKKEPIVEKTVPNPTRNINVLDFEKEAARKVSDLYSTGKELIKEKPRFKATPVISPVYGILDKNYKKEEVKERDEAPSLMKRPSKKVDFETVRKKAFGNLADEIKDNLLCENCELYKEVKKISALKEDDLLYDMTVDDEEKPVTIEKAYDNYEEFGVAYEPKTKSVPLEELDAEEQEPLVVNNMESETDEVESRIDDIINKTHKIDSAVINDHNDEEDVQVLSKPDVVYSNKIDDEEIPTNIPQDIPNRTTKKSDTKVDEDFFELIDSMYKERSDE